VIDLSLTEEQELVASTVREFVERELRPHEEEVERLGLLPQELAAALKRKAIDAGLYALNMPEELGGGGLDYVTSSVAEMELARTSWALNSCVARPTHILLACEGEQRERYLLPTIRGERSECFALTEPGAGSDARSIQTRAARDGRDWVINGTKQFISHVDHADYIILVTVTGEDETPKGPRPRFTTFLVDKDLPGIDVAPVGCVSARGYNAHLIGLTDVRVPDSAILGEEGRGFDFATEWLYASRVMMAAHCTGRARLVLELAADWARTRRQFGRPIGEFQGVSFKLADMETELRAAWLLTMHASWKLDQGTLEPVDASVAKLHASEMLGRVADHGVQIFGGMGVSTELPIERYWRDARVERIWEGTSEIHRDLIGRAVLRGQ
jgi:alkylation response protein AidB-like acyl-CoA dehydrogenase